MLRLTRFREREDGAIAIIVAMLFFFGVMLALGALTVDVGNINADRRQLQNSADAVALAVAQQCATTGTCAPTATNLGDLANANAADNATAIKRVDNQLPLSAPVTTPAYPAICGNATGLLPCQTTWIQSMSNLQECPSDPPTGVNYVRVYAETKNSAGNNILPYYFGAAITGISGANQQACATVVWGPPSGAAAPITLSYCEWAAATGSDPLHPVLDGTGTYANPPVGAGPGYPGYGAANPWPTPAPQLPLQGADGQEIIIQLQGAHATTCSSWNGHDVPGGFGYLSSSTSCTSVALVGGWIKVDTGNTLPGGCPSMLPYFNTVIYLPVFDCVATGTVSTPPTGTVTSCASGNGNNTWYRIAGYAKFYLSGYVTSGSGVPDKNNDRTQTVTPQAPCSGSDRCLSGWFLKGLVETPPAPPPPPGTPLLGAYSIALAG
ncbi:MAG TPA: Tad domain-containing protein [Dermatophilaceae bacterium]|jgi:hypothetical protein